MKCDLGQPTCKNCARLKVPCEGYARKYSWIPPKLLGQQRRLSDPDSIEEVEESQSSRRVLFSGENQAPHGDARKLICAKMKKGKRWLYR